MKKFTCDIEVTLDDYELEAKNKQDYIKKLKESVYDEYGIYVYDDEIKNLKEVK